MTLLIEYFIGEQGKVLRLLLLANYQSFFDKETEMGFVFSALIPGIRTNM